MDILKDVSPLRIKVEIFPKNLKSFSAGSSLKCISFSKEVDAFKKKYPSDLKIFGKRILIVESLSEEDADNLNDLFFRLKKETGTIKPERFLGLLISVYLLGLFIGNSKSKLFAPVNKKSAKKTKLEKRDVYLESGVELELAELLKVFQGSKKLIHKNLDAKAIKQEFPPRLKDRRKYDIAWMSHLAKNFQEIPKPILLLPPPKAKVRDLLVQREKGLCYLKVEEVVHKVPPKVFQFAQYLSAQGIDNESRADKQDWLLQKAGLRGGFITDLWKEKRPPKNHPLPVRLLKDIFLSVRGKYYLNPKVTVLPII